MAITATERSQIVELTVLMFNAAPGAEYLSQIVSIYETSGRSLQTLASILAGTSAYASLNPNTQTAEAFATAFLTPLGLQNDAVARDFIIAKMNAGVSKGAIVYEAYAALNSVPDSANNQYSAANAILNNKVAVALYYSVDRAVAATDLASLQGALSGVTADPASVTSAKAAIDATLDFTIMAAAASVNEGASITVHMTNGAPNTEYVLRVDSAHASDVGSQLTMVTTDANGTAHATIAVTADRVTEGAETLTISVVGQTSVSTTVTVNDTSMDNAAPAISASATLAVNEGKSATFDVAVVDAEGDAVTVTAAAGSGTVVKNNDGTYTYTPNAGFSGSDTVTITAVDALGASSSQTIAVTVDANDAPIAQAGGDAANEGGAAVSGQLVATDADAGDTLTFSLNAPVEGLTLNADGSYTFNPAQNTAANALVYSDAPLAIVANYTVTDSLGATSQSTLTITVTPKPLTFTLTKAGTSVQEGASQVYTVTASEAVTSATDVVFTLLPGDGSAGNTGSGNTNTADFATGSFNPVTATIAAGSSTATFTVTPVNDATTELPESFTVQAQVGGSTLTLGGTTVDATTAGGVGQTFTLTTGVDTIPGLIGSANSAGTDGNDTIVATNTTLTVLDSLNGGLGADTLNFTDLAGGSGIPAGVVLSNVETFSIRSAGAATIDLTAAGGVTGVTALNSTQSTTATLTAAATTDIGVSGATGAIAVIGGKNVTVTDAGTNNGITIGGAAVADPAGTITVTDTNVGTGAIAIDGGTDVTVTASGGAGGAITIGANTAATGVVNVTATGAAYTAATANTTLGNIGVTGGKTITVTQQATSNTSAAAADTGNSTITQGDITIVGSASTTTVSVKQDATVAVANAANTTGGVTESASVKFGVLKSGDALTVAGLTFTASADMTAAQVAAAFANLSAGTQSGGSAGLGTYTGTSASWTSGAASGDTVVFTSTTARTNVGDLAPVLTDNAPAADSVAPVVTTTQGKAHDATPAGGKMGVATGAVSVTDAAGTVTTITIDGYKTGSSTTGTSVLQTLNLSNSDAAATITVADTASTLALNLEKVSGTVTFTAAPTTLNVTSTGANSAVLNSATTTALNVSGTGVLTTGASNLAAVKDVVVTGAAGLNLTGATLTALETITSTGTTGAVTATINGAQTAYAGGAGVDTVTLATATALTKSINLGAGDDTLSFGALSVSGSTAALSGGDGTDTLSMSTAAADALDAVVQTFYTGFERLTINDSAATATIDLANLGFTSYVTTNGSAGTLTLNNLANNGTVVINAAAVGHTVNIKDAATGTADVLNVVLSSSGNLAAGVVTAANVETVNISTVDTQAAPQTKNVDSLTLTADKATTVNVSGSADLTLTMTGSTKVTAIDGSAMTGGLTVTSLNTTSATTITGGSGNDSLTAATGTTADVLNGGAGNDTLTANAGLSTLTGGAGADLFVIGVASLNSSSYATITDFQAGDRIQVTGADSFAAARVTQGDTAVFQDYANAAMNAVGVNDVAWFQYQGNTYIVADMGVDSTTFVNSQDFVVRLTGLVDLTNASFNDTSDTIGL